MADERLDLSSLDPSRDQLRWERMIRATTARAVQARRPMSFGRQVIAWARPVMAVAASIALVAAVALVAGGRSTTSQRDTTEQLLEWANNGTMPADFDVGSLLGSGNGH